MSVFSERLKLLRGKETQTTFAKRLGIKQVTYGRYELGTREPDLDTLIRIGLVLNVSIDWLLGVSDLNEEKNKEALEKVDALKDAIRNILDKF